MPRPSRARRILKWTGVGLSLVVFVIWLASPWFIATIGLSRKTQLGFWVGGVAITTGSFPRSEGFGDGYIAQHRWVGWGWDWSPVTIVVDMPVAKNDIFSSLGLSYWFLFLILVLPTAWLWHRDRRWIRPGYCLRCGYDLTGNTSGVCSECGLPATPSHEKLDR